MSDYVPPAGDALDANFLVVSYAPPAGYALNVNFTNDTAPGANTPFSYNMAIWEGGGS